MPDSKILNFVEAVKRVNYKLICSEPDTDKMDSLLLGALMEVLETSIPRKTVKLKVTDKRFFTNE